MIKYLLKFLLDYIDQFKEKISSKDYKGIFLSCIGLLSIVAASILVLWAAITMFSQLVHIVADNLIYIAGFVLVGIWGTVYIKGKIQERHDALASQKNREFYEAELAHKEVNEDSYRIIRDIMYKVLLDVSKNCNLAPPDDESSLNAPLHCIERDGAILYQYIAIKRGEVSIRTIIALINSRISQLAEEKKLGFDPSMVMVLGKLYPAVLLDTATDCSNYVQLSIAPVTENYIKQRIDRDRHKNQPPFMKNGNDHDF